MFFFLANFDLINIESGRVCERWLKGLSSACGTTAAGRVPNERGCLSLTEG